MYGRKACQLVKDVSSGEKEQIKAFNNDLLGQVIQECSVHHVELQSLIRKMQEQGLNTQLTRNPDHFGALIHHLALIRNKRCLMAYMYNRAAIIQSLRWKVGNKLPQEIQEKLDYCEDEYFKNHSAALDSYMSELELDLTVDFVPPKDPYIQVRVLDDIGEVVLSDKSANLAPHSIHFLKRTDAEPLISQLFNLQKHRRQNKHSRCSVHVELRAIHQASHLR